MIYKPGEAHQNAKLTEKDVCDIRKMYEETGMTQKAIAITYGISQAQVSKIINRVIWTCVEGGRKRTNGDVIRHMRDQELAELIGDYIDCSICKKKIFNTTECPGAIAIGGDCYSIFLCWLKQEAE